MSITIDDLNNDLANMEDPNNYADFGNPTQTLTDMTTMLGQSPQYWTIPWTAWEYFVFTGGSGDFYWAPSSAQNGTAFTPSSSGTWGAPTFVAPVNATYQFTVNIRQYSNQGIANFTIDGVQTPCDCYYGGGGTSGQSYVWSQVLTAGAYTIALDSLTKNGSSSDYWIIFEGDGLKVQQLYNTFPTTTIPPTTMPPTTGP
jgi:hypothetical protein